MVCDEAMCVNMHRCLANAARDDDRGIIVAMLRSIASAASAGCVCSQLLSLTGQHPHHTFMWLILEGEEGTVSLSVPILPRPNILYQFGNLLIVVPLATSSDIIGSYFVVWNKVAS